MDNLERLNPNNFTDEVINEINSMSYEEISALVDIPGFFLIRDKSTNKPYTGQSTYRSLAVLHRLGHGKRFEVVGAPMNVTNNVAASAEEVNEIDDFIAPEQTIVDIENPDPEKDSTEGDSTEEEVNAPDDNIQSVAEPIQNDTPGTEDLKPETGNESAVEVKATKSKRSK